MKFYPSFFSLVHTEVKALMHDSFVTKKTADDDDDDELFVYEITYYMSSGT